MAQTPLSTILSNNVHFNPDNVKATYLADPSKAYAVMLDNVLSAEECQAMINHTEQTQQYEQALVNIGYGKQTLMTDVRSSDRYMTDDPMAANLLWARIQRYVPTHWREKPATGLNERLRFLRYDVGQEFKPHYDGSFVRPDGSEKSNVTLMIYLNGDSETLIGGGTKLFQSREIPQDYIVPPRPGRMLLFQHPLLHSGEPVESGRKYAIRTDVMFGTRTAQINTAAFNSNENNNSSSDDMDSEDL